MKSKSWQVPQEQALYKLALDHYEKRQKELQKSLDEFLAPFKEKLQGDRIRQLPADVQEAINTPEEKRTPAQKKLAEDYAPIIRIDPPKYREIMTPEQIKIYEGLRTPLLTLAKPADLETFLDGQRRRKPRQTEKSYSGYRRPR